LGDAIKCTTVGAEEAAQSFLGYLRGGAEIAAGDGFFYGGEDLVVLLMGLNEDWRMNGGLT